MTSRQSSLSRNRHYSFVKLGIELSLVCVLFATISTPALAQVCSPNPPSPYSSTGTSVTCSSGTYNGKIGAPEGAGLQSPSSPPLSATQTLYTDSTVTINAGSIINAGNSSAISLYDNAIINVYGTVQNSSTNAAGSFGTGGNTIEFKNNGVLTVGVNGLVRATGTQTSGEAVNVQGTGNTITNYGVIESTRNNVAAIWSQNAGTLSIDNYGIIASGNRNADNNNTVIGGNTGAGISFTNRTGATVYGKFALGNGNDTIALYTGSTVTGSINAGGGDDTLYLLGTGAQSLPTNVTNFSHLYKQDSGTWTLSSTLTNVLSGATPRTLDVLGGTLILTGDNSAYTGTTTVASGATLQGPTSAIPISVTNTGLVSFNEPGTGTYSGVISGTGSVEKIDAGTTTFTQANTYTGATSVNAGILSIASGASLASSSATIASGASLTNSGAISGTINNSGYVLNAASGTLTGNITNQASATIDDAGALGTNATKITITNNGTLNLNGTQTLYANIINNGLTNLNTTQNMSDTNFTNNGTLSPANSGTNLVLTGSTPTTGIYSQSSGANFITRIDGLSSGSYSQIISNQPINIASGAVITAALNPALILHPGDIIPAVIQGTGTATQQGTITVNTVSDRYKLLSNYTQSNLQPGANSQVNLYLPANTDGILHLYDAPGTYYGALKEQTLATVSAIQVPTLGVLHQRYALLNAVTEYHCNKFDKHNFCISAQARSTGFGTQATGAGVLNVAYRPIPQMHVGAFIDYQAAAGNPAVNGSTPAITLNNGGVQYGYDNPTFGGYAGFSQSGYSGNLINNGLQVMVSGAYNPGKITVTRALVMNPFLPFVDSQPGSGSASLNSSVIRGMVGYGFALTDRVTLMPYGGIRFTDVTRGAYMEGFNAVVTQPLAYNSFYERLLTGYGGAMLNGKITDRFGAIIGLGLETDLTRYANSLSGYSPIAIEYMTNFGFDHGGTWNGLRPTGNAGAYYDIAPNQRISLNGFAGQQAWTSRSYATGLLGYQVAF